MTRRAPFLRSALALLLTALAPPLAAQQQTGDIHGKVVDGAAAPLPGVSVTISGSGVSATQVTSGSGEYRFLNLGPGRYTLTHVLSGFATVRREGVAVSIGRSTELTVPLSLSTVATDLVVTAEAPVLDTRKITTGVNVTRQELEAVPTARDPWAILGTVPGVLLDRVNVAGSESGQQSTYVSKGAAGAQSTWNVDGVNITDMGALGSSPTYYDFDSFAELQTTTGGSDPTVQTPGLQLNMVTKRGTNDVHGSGRVLITDHRWQSSGIPDELSQQLVRRGQNAVGNSIDGVQDYGAEIGGPLVKDRVWLWGSYGRQQSDRVTAAGFADKTLLENVNAKLNAQLFEGNSFDAFFLRGDKVKNGRDSGPSRPPETAWNQSGPTTVYKLEDSHVFSSNVFATVTYARPRNGFRLVTSGQDPADVDSQLIWHRGYLNYDTDRPQSQLSGNVSVFASTGSLGHELKVGFSYRTTVVNSSTSWPGGVITYSPEYQGTNDPVVAFVRDGIRSVDQRYASLYLSDTVTAGGLTLNVGARYDDQRSTNRAVDVPCCRYGAALYPFVPLKPLSAVEVEGPHWKDVQPRVGLTYALGSDRKTLLRASYSRFADQLGGTVASYNGITLNGPSYLYYYWNDKNGNGRLDPGETDSSTGVIASSYISADDPNPTRPQNRVADGFKAGKTDELLVAFEREVLPAFAISAVGTYRKLTDFAFAHGDGVTRNDYDCTNLTGTLPWGLPYNGGPYCTPKAGVVFPRGLVIDNQAGYSQRYVGLELSAMKRYSNRWMARASVTINDWTQKIDPNGVTDPTNSLPGTNVDGGIVVQGSTSAAGAKGGVYINSRWQVSASALYSLPWAVNLSASFFAREGYPLPYYVRKFGAPGVPVYEAVKYVNVLNLDSARLGTVSDLDLGLAKVLKVGGTDFTLSVDVFNVLNRNTVLQRQLRLERSTTNDILEVQSPRIVRFGGRISF